MTAANCAFGGIRMLYPTVWSEKDEETIRFLRKHGYFLSLVGNKLAQYSLRVDYSTGASEQWLP